MTENTQHPFESFPATRRVVDELGHTAFHIAPRTLSPIRAKAADILSAVISILSGGSAVLYLRALQSSPDWLWAFCLVTPCIAYPALKYGLRSLFKKRVRFILSARHFKVKRWNGWESYDRTLPHKFTLIPHDWTQTEEDRNQVATQRAQALGQIVGKPRYFGKSFHLCFDYVGQRRYLLTIFKSKTALAVLARLNSCDEVLNTQARMGAGISMSPDDQWTQQPGDILESDACIR